MGTIWGDMLGGEPRVIVDSLPRGEVICGFMLVGEPCLTPVISLIKARVVAKAWAVLIFLDEPPEDTLGSFFFLVPRPETFFPLPLAGGATNGGNSPVLELLGGVVPPPGNGGKSPPPVFGA